MCEWIYIVRVLLFHISNCFLYTLKFYLFSFYSSFLVKKVDQHSISADGGYVLGFSIRFFIFLKFQFGGCVCNKGERICVCLARVDIWWIERTCKWKQKTVFNPKKTKKKFECISGLIEILVDPCVIHRYTGSQKFTSPGGLFPLQFVFFFLNSLPPPITSSYYGNGMDLCIYTTEKTSARETHTHKSRGACPTSQCPAVLQCSS
jgi:hypothetical protein